MLQTRILKMFSGAGEREKQMRQEKDHDERELLLQSTPVIADILGTALWCPY